MKSAALLREQIESSLSAKNPAALSPRLRPEIPRILCGTAEIDAVLHGGLPVGVIAELVGPECSGRTAMALAYMAAITRNDGVCAWIDAADSLDPESAAVNGVDLGRLLWVRCGAGQAIATPKLAKLADANGGSGFALAKDPSMMGRHTGGGSPHPRSEANGMPQAIGALLQAHGGMYDKHVRRETRMSKVGTPGAPNRPLLERSEHREEQVNSDRLPPRRGDNLAISPRCCEIQPRRPAREPSNEILPHEVSASPRAFKAPAGSPWQALDQALRAADLLLQNGGFAAIVLDLGSVLPEFAWRIPLATWFRFRAACERTRVSLVLLTQHPCARSSAELVVRLQVGAMQAESKVMSGIGYRTEMERNRSQERERVVSIRKPPQSERLGRWQTEAAWVQAK